MNNHEHDPKRHEQSQKVINSCEGTIYLNKYSKHKNQRSNGYNKYSKIRSQWRQPDGKTLALPLLNNQQQHENQTYIITTGK